MGCLVGCFLLCCWIGLVWGGWLVRLLLWLFLWLLVGYIASALVVWFDLVLFYCVAGVCLQLLRCGVLFVLDAATTGFVGWAPVDLVFVVGLLVLSEVLFGGLICVVLCPGFVWAGWFLLLVVV